MVRERKSVLGGFSPANLGGGIQKEVAGEETDTYAKFHDGSKESEQARKEDYTKMVNLYYDLATEFYEYGWGSSFHFSNRFKGESHDQGMRRHEHYLALKLQLKKDDRVLDVGCGIGGPLREICKFTGAKITGLNNNAYQISRGETLNSKAGPFVTSRCNYVKADFLKMPFDDASFDAVYAIEATCHAPSAVSIYKEIFRVLKPGQRCALYEWCMTDDYDPSNAAHQQIKRDIEIGNGLPDIRTCSQVVRAMEEAGFKVIESDDLATSTEVPWYEPLDPSRFSLQSFRTTWFGRMVTRNLVWAMEALRLAPRGSGQVSSILETGADALVTGGKKFLFTPMFLVVGEKPLDGGRVGPTPSVTRRTGH